MKTMSKFAVVLGVIALLGLLVVPTFAADTTKQIVIQETDINASYWVTNPSWRAVTDRSVDLQTGQVVVTETITRRTHDPVEVVITYTPSVNNGRVYWTATAIYKDGTPVSDDFLKEINDHMTASWHHYIREHRIAGHITAIAISDTTVTITVSVPSTAHNA